MEIIFIVEGAITLALLVVHLADYFLSWPPQPLAIGRPHPPFGGPRGMARRSLPEPYSYDRAA